MSKKTWDAATSGLTPDPGLPALVLTQPEFTIPIWAYLDRAVSYDRVSRGRASYQANRALFARIGKRFDVDPYILAAIWGIETDYGAILSSKALIKPIIRSLATLAYNRRDRVEADELEFLAALTLLEQSDGSSSELVGSWAGAIGHLQIIASGLLAWGIDGDGDHRIDVHSSLADAIATSANYLTNLGYQPGLDWGYEVEVPEGFDYMNATRNEMKQIAFFARLGVKRVHGRRFEDSSQRVFLYAPAGHAGPKFLMTPNYLVLKAYNFSDSYALAIAHLTDRLKGGGDFSGKWPRNTKFPNLEQRIAIQKALKVLGHYTAETDGRIGPLTQAAYQFYQQQQGLIADGFITLDAYQRLKAKAGP